MLLVKTFAAGMPFDVLVSEAVCLITICQAWLRWWPQIAEGEW
jgi:hypothetical protein